MLKRSLSISTGYLFAGVLWSIASYIATGFSPFAFYNWDLDAAIPLPEIATAFVLHRFEVALVFGPSLAWCLGRQGLSRYAIATLCVALPVLYELVVGWPFDSSWVGMFMGLAATWPNPPVYIGPPDMILRTTTAHLGPPLMAGVTMAFWLLHRRGFGGRQQRQDGDNGSTSQNAESRPPSISN